MIPSDHFVRFYNEVFKFLDHAGPGTLEAFWAEIGRHQERHCLKLFREKGLAGMYEYWDHIRREENCDMDIVLTDDSIELKMKKCPSLSKNLDNDAGCFERYCDHCPAWDCHIMTAAGYWLVYDLVDRRRPQCREFVFKERSKALRKFHELQRAGCKLLVTNLGTDSTEK